MEIIVCRDYEEMSRRAAELTAEGLRRRPDGLLSFAGGETPLGTVHAFADLVNRGEVDISRAHYTSLDESLQTRAPAASSTARSFWPG